MNYDNPLVLEDLKSVLDSIQYKKNHTLRSS